MKTRLLVIILTMGGTCIASLIDEGFLSLTGTGIGAVPTILTVQAGGIETGCVAWNGSADVIGNCHTTFGVFPGGDEKTGSSQTQTELVSAAMPLNGFTGAMTGFGNLALVVNADQPAGSSINLTRLILSVYSPSGVLQGSVEDNCPAGGCVLNPTATGIGKSGYVFQVSADEVKSLGTFSTADRVGVAATFSGAAGGPETIFLGSSSALQSGSAGGGAGGSPVPEPSSWLLLGCGIVGIAARAKLKRV